MNNHPTPINGRLNKWGVVIPLEGDGKSIFAIRKEDEERYSTIYRVFCSGNVKVVIYLVQFSDGKFACSSEFITSHSGSCGLVSLRNERGDRDVILDKEIRSIIRSIEEKISDESACKDGRTDSDCRKVLSMLNKIEQRSLSLIF